MANINFDTWVSGLGAASSISGADSIPVVQGGVTKKVDPTILGPLTKDINGNYIANIVPRTGTLASLLAITNAGDGELASATDIDAIVKYSGNAPSVGKIYYKNSYLGRVSVQFLGQTSIASGTVLQLDNTTLRTSDILSSFSISVNTTSSTNNYIDFSSLFPTVTSVSARLSGYIAWAAGATFDGSYRGSLIEAGPFSTSFVSQNRARFPFTASSNILVDTPFFSSIDLSSVFALVRIKAEHNATVNPTIGASGGISSGIIFIDIYQTS